MNALLPFDSLLTSNLNVGLVVTLLTGFAFGFVLERSGFGQSTKLAAQFYLKDMTVFKVMFGAIVTAMVGLVIAGGVGLVDLDSLVRGAASFTYFWPMLVGGLLLGVGFIVSGYCPGTSIVASASGNVDGMMTVLGVVIGSVLFGELYPFVGTWAVSSNWGHFFLPEALGVSRALLAVGVTVMAIGAFFGAEAVERRFNKEKAEEAKGSPKRRVTRKVAVFGSLGAAAVAGLVITLAVPATASSSRRHPEGIDVDVLAKRVVEAPWSVRVLDLRGEAAWTKARIPRSEPVELDALERLGLQYIEDGTDLVVVGEQTIRDLPPEVSSYPGRVLSLRGGFAAWNRYALQPPRPPSANASEEERERYRFRAALSSMLTGQAAAAPPTRPVRAVGPRRAAGGGGCS